MTTSTLYPYPGDVVRYVTSFGNSRTVLVDWSGWSREDGGCCFTGRQAGGGMGVWGRVDQIVELLPLYPGGYHYCEGKPFQIACEHNDGECCVKCVNHSEFVTLRHDETVDGCMEAFWVFDENLRDWLAVRLMDIFMARLDEEEDDDRPAEAVALCGQTVGVERLFLLLTSHLGHL